MDELGDLLDSLDFAGARSLIAEADEADRPELQSRLDEALEDAEDRAEQLAGRIQSMARADHYEGLLALVQDPSTEPLLDLLTPEIKRGASLHLDGARRRQERFQTAAAKHIDEAREALVLLDTTRARGQLDRIDRRWLDTEQRSELDALLAQVEDAAAERRDIEARTAEVLKDHHPSQSPPKRRSRTPEAPSGRGCGTSVLVVLLVALAAILI